jgi:membrane protein
MLFTLVYMIMPNTKVTFKSGLIAGIIAGTAFQLLQYGYINFQGLLSRYGTIYGSFAALPLFIGWLQISWLIVLFGAEISFANQNINKYEFESESLNISHYYREILTLYIAHLVIKNFIRGDKAMTAASIGSELEVPVRIVRNIIYDLTESGIFSEIATDSEKERAYQPAMDVNQLSVAYVLERIDKKGRDEIDVGKSEKLKALSKVQDSFKELIAKSSENKLLKDV